MTVTVPLIVQLLLMSCGGRSSIVAPEVIRGVRWSRTVFAVGAHLPMCDAEVVAQAQFHLFETLRGNEPLELRHEIPAPGEAVRSFECPIPSQGSRQAFRATY
jgi:hypothetical protein